MAIQFKDASALTVTLQAFARVSGSTFSVGTPIQTLVMRNVFARDENFAEIADPTEEDEYEIGSDGSVCITVGDDGVKILTLRLSSCNDVIEDLIRLKKRRYLGSRVSFRLTLSDASTGYLLISNDAAMITNPSILIGNANTPQEVRFILTEVIESDTIVRTEAEFSAGVAEIAAGISLDGNANPFNI